MQKSFAHLLAIILRLAIVLLIYTVCRLLFYIFNYSYFSDAAAGDLLSYFISGLKFDLSAIVVINCVYIIFQLLPVKARHHKVYRHTMTALFHITNSIGILANCIDLVYFTFTFKRTTADALDFFTMGEDLRNLMPVFVKDYWYVFLIWLLLTFCMIWLYRKTPATEAGDENRWYLKHSVIFAITLPLFLLAYRGGFQLKPISIISAGEYAVAKHIPLVVNTPFTIIKTLEQPGIEPKIYFTEAEANAIFKPYQRGGKRVKKKMNVVVIILESFSKEYIGALSGNESYTPFLDSLIKKSYVFTNAYANGKRSIEALPAIVAGIPTLMNEPYLTSVYGSNRISSIATALKEKGYTTSFYHGGINGTMGFDAFAKLAGFDAYYGRNEYNNDEHYDGNWGIWDEEFYQYFAQGLNTTKQPFLSAFFSLSSHHPFEIPAKYESTFKDGPLEIHRSVRYADHALKRFFETASKMKWYKNTLFVITADHTGPPEKPYYNTSVGMHAVPIIFFKGDGSMKGTDDRMMQHIDIMPTVLGYTGYAQRYFAFGNDMSNKKQRSFAVHFVNNTYQLLQHDYALHFNGSNTTGFYNFTTDSLMASDVRIQKRDTAHQMEKLLKAFIQVYHNSLINNSMTVK